MADASRITVPQMARVWLAPVGTTAPADATTAMGVGWFDVGFFTPDSLQFATSPNFEAVNSHQSNYPTRRFQTTDAATIEVDLQEWSGQNFIAVFGGGSVAAVTPPTTPPTYKFTPPAVGGRSNIAAVIEIIDGTKHYRRVVPVCLQIEGVTQKWAKTAESTLPLRLAVIGSDVGDPFYDLSDDPAFAPAT